MCIAAMNNALLQLVVPEAPVLHVTMHCNCLSVVVASITYWLASIQGQHWVWRSPYDHTNSIHERQGQTNCHSAHAHAHAQLLGPHHVKCHCNSMHFPSLDGHPLLTLAFSLTIHNAQAAIQQNTVLG
jgi:hypothetical protein